MRGTTKRRLVLGASALAIVAITLTGCAGPSSNADESHLKLSDDDVTLRFTWWGSDSRAEITNKAIEAFEKKNPNITVEGDYKDFTTYWDALATSTAGGHSPDVIQMDELYLASYADRGALLDLGTASDIIDTTNFDDSSLGTGTVGDTLYGIPNGIVGYGILANVGLFERYGVDIPDDTSWTWDDVAAVAQELSDKSGGAIHGAGALGGLDAGSLRFWARSDGGDLFNAKGNVVIEPRTLEKLWKFNLRLIGSHAAESASAMVEGLAAGVAGSSLATNKVGIGVGYSNQISTYEAASGNEFKILQMPSAGKRHPNFLKPSQFWTVSSQSKHPAEAAALVDFLLNSPEAADILTAERGIPASSKIRSRLEAGLSPADQQAVAFLDALHAGDAPPVTPNGGSGVEAILQRYAQQVYFGQTNPKKAAEAFVREVQGEIDAAK